MAVNDLHVKLAGGQKIVGGYSVNVVAAPSGSFTLNPLLGNYQYRTNTGAFTITAPTVDCAIDMLIIMDTGAATISFSGFTVGTTGDTLTYTFNAKFIISFRRMAGVSTYVIKALQ